jgi:hypothetical protein
VAKQQVWFEAKPRNFEKTANGVRWEAVIFSSEFNRNSAYFDIYKLARWKNKLEKILLNNGHNGKYFSITTDKLLSIEVKTDDNGVTECFAVVESTNPEKIANPESVTGFSIELMVDAKDVISNENGEYYIDYEWVGMAYLLGELAGSGDTRLLSMKTFNQKNNNFMQENQIKELLEAQKTELVKEFSIILENQIKELSSLQTFKQADNKEEEKPTEETPPPTDTEDDELKKVENQLNQAEKLKNQMKTVANFEKVTDQRQNQGAEKTAKISKVPSFYTKLFSKN